MDYKNLKDIIDIVQDISFIIYSNNEFQKLETENKELKIKIKELDKYQEPLIITEGKTDWKYFISALDYFHSRNEYQNIKESWFLKFGSEDDITTKNCGTYFNLTNSVSILNRIIDSFIETRNFETIISIPVRVGIFDSDDGRAKERNDVKNKVYSFLIKPEDISTELLFSNSEIKTKISSKRLYIGNEFDKRTCQ